MPTWFTDMVTLSTSDMNTPEKHAKSIDIRIPQLYLFFYFKQKLVLDILTVTNSRYTATKYMCIYAAIAILKARARQRPALNMRLIVLNFVAKEKDTRPPTQKDDASMQKT